MGKSNLSNNIISNINKFIVKYSEDALLDALKNYDSLQQEYICRTQTYIKKIPISSINYIEIFGHDIFIHTDNETLVKYGTLKNEYKKLKKWGFVRCNQSFLIPINKIAEIRGRDVILTTGDKFILSRSCATEVIYTYTKSNIND